MRIAPITPGTRPELAALEAQILAERGRISPLYQILLNSPAITHGWEQMLSAVRNRNSLPASLRELVILRVAILNRAPYEFDAHVPHALKAGVPQAVIDATRMPSIESDAPFSPAERVAMQLTDTMTRDIEVPDVLFADVQIHFDTQAQIDLVATIAAYNMVSRFLVALQIGH
ncbi:MAG: carboxymuconolactone decarboxylase family protein [Rhodoferax sp.]|uniref:carboxymuconolactone decarboxylase family protein n=1 Tax=Rhodoferax sp. TaxID=50421 RepID=UPI00273262C3|nr:carboxymuconolactone decarboxylase family protein [Rhodoferax sp.]MDP2679056.1 carboxymuconolactone decarboxylase family protein [Rhodoferax sp.]